MALQHTYRVRHKGIESTPHSLADLRQMWKAGQIDSSTQFKRGDSPVWLDASDLWAELNFEMPAAAAGTAGANLPPGPLRPGASGNLVPVAPIAVRVTSVRIPFQEIVALLLKIALALLFLAAVGAALWMLLARLLP